MTQFLAFCARRRFGVRGKHASASVTASDTDLKLSNMADADRRVTGTNAFTARFVYVGGQI